MSEDDLEKWAIALEASPDYRVLRKLKPRARFCAEDGSEKLSGIFLDTETTGLDPARDEVIELGMIPFEFSRDGRLFEIGKAFSRLRKPSIPITPEITRLTGITDEMVDGCDIPIEDVARELRGVSLVIAHNAGFDRPFAEKHWPCFSEVGWACSWKQVPWQVEGILSSRLDALGVHFGFFYEGHRAIADCYAGVEVLGQILPRSRRSVLSQLLETARKVEFRIWAIDAPFSARLTLKQRGYTWSDGIGKPYRAWYIDVFEDSVEGEVGFLSEHVYEGSAQPIIARINAFQRYSLRA